MRHGAFLRAACLAAAVACGCAAADRAAYPSGQPAAAPGGGGPAAVVLRGPNSIRASVVVSYQRADSNRASLEGTLAADRPDRLRLATHFGFLEAFTLNARGDSFWVTIPHYDAQLAGRKDQVRITPLDPARLSQALFLRAGDADSLPVDSVVADTAGAWASGHDSLGQFRIRLDTRDQPQVLERSRGGNPPFLRVEFERYAVVDGGRYPRRITWRDLERRQTLVMEFDQVVLNSATEARRFEPPRGGGLRTIPWTSWEELFSGGK